MTLKCQTDVVCDGSTGSVLEALAPAPEKGATTARDARGTGSTVPSAPDLGETLLSSAGFLQTCYLS